MPRSDDAGDGGGRGAGRPRWDRIRAEVSRCPRPLVLAAVLVVLEALVLVRLGVSELLNIGSEGADVAVAVAVFFAAYAVLLGAAAVGLVRRAGWPRGPVLITQLIVLGLAYNVRDLPVLAVLLAVVAVIAGAAMLHPASIEALGVHSGADDPPSG